MRILRGVAILVIVVGVLAAALIALLVDSYVKLDTSARVAAYSISPIDADNGRYEVALKFENGASATYKIAGQGFEIRAEVMSPKGIAENVLGEKQRVRLSLIGGIYEPEVEATYPPACFDPDDTNWIGAQPCRTVYTISDQQYRTPNSTVSKMIGAAGTALLKASGSKFEMLTPNDTSSRGIWFPNSAAGEFCVTKTERGDVSLVIRPAPETCGTGASEIKS